MRTKTVILLESNKAVLAQLNEAFEGCEDLNVIYSGDDGDDGIKQILNLKPDLVVIGMFLKGTDGCGVIHATRKALPETKIVAMGLASDEMIERALTEGAAYYLLKPFTIQTAMERIKELMKDKPSTKNEMAISIKDRFERSCLYLFVIAFVSDDSVNS